MNKITRKLWKGFDEFYGWIFETMNTCKTVATDEGRTSLCSGRIIGSFTHSVSVDVDVVAGRT